MCIFFSCVLYHFFLPSTRRSAIYELVPDLRVDVTAGVLSFPSISVVVHNVFL